MAYDSLSNQQIPMESAIKDCVTKGQLEHWEFLRIQVCQCIQDYTISPNTSLATHLSSLVHNHAPAHSNLEELNLEAVGFSGPTQGTPLLLGLSSFLVDAIYLAFLLESSTDSIKSCLLSLSQSLLVCALLALINRLKISC